MRRCAARPGAPTRAARQVMLANEEEKRSLTAGEITAARAWENFVRLEAAAARAAQQQRYSSLEEAPPPHAHPASAGGGAWAARRG